MWINTNWCKNLGYSVYIWTCFQQVQYNKHENLQWHQILGLGTQNECLVTIVDNFAGHETFTIPRIAAYVPVIQPRSPNNIMATSFTMINTEGRLPSADNVNSSIIGGNIRASELLARAPIRAISKSRCGITMAIAPTNRQ